MSYEQVAYTRRMTAPYQNLLERLTAPPKQLMDGVEEIPAMYKMAPVESAERYDGVRPQELALIILMGSELTALLVVLLWHCRGLLLLPRLRRPLPPMPRPTLHATRWKAPLDVQRALARRIRTHLPPDSLRAVASDRALAAA